MSHDEGGTSGGRSRPTRRGGGQPYSIDKLTDSVGLGNYCDTNNLVTLQKVVDNCNSAANVYTFWWGGLTLDDTIVILTDLETDETRVYIPVAGDPSVRVTWPCS